MRGYRTAYDDLDRTEIARRYGRAAAYREDAEQTTAFWLRFLAVFFVGALFVALASYTLAQVTSRDSARRIFGRAIPEISDFDHTLSVHYEELRSSASGAGAANGVTLPTYPIRAVLAPAEVINRSPTEVRQTLLIRASDAVYDRGSNAFSTRGGPVKMGNFGLLSAPWMFNQALDVMNPAFHARVQKVARVALVVAIVLGVILLPLSRDYNQIVMYGMALLIAAIPLLVLSAIAWLIVQRVFGTSLDPLVAGTSDLTRDAAWFVVLSYLVYAGIALALVTLGLLVERIGDVVARPRDPANSAQYRA
jgi:hypothetical protein